MAITCPTQIWRFVYRNGGNEGNPESTLAILFVIYVATIHMHMLAKHNGYVQVAYMSITIIHARYCNCDGMMCAGYVSMAYAYRISTSATHPPVREMLLWHLWNY